MILIDLGNSYAKILKAEQFLTVKTDRIIKWLNKNYFNEVDIFICSVVPHITIEIKKLFPRIRILDNKIYNKLFAINNPLLYKKGADRIITGYGALRKYTNNLIVIDMGTCITVDTYINNEYQSGYIFPGLNILRYALTTRVSHLPTPVDPLTNSKFIIDTADQMFWGNIYGLIGVINQFVKMEKLKNKVDFQVILTGGTIKEFENFLKKNQLQDLFTFEHLIDEKLIFYAMKLIINEKIIA
ncbi:MAG: type III pantothenate kinase [Mycoplasmatales bacterium]